ncbi:MAG TPA: hypothetical protein VFB58_03800 [Chloroflexota bacterium]|nr:hypothetical protein [Chloroflexota bacterium]
MLPLSLTRGILAALTAGALLVATSKTDIAGACALSTAPSAARPVLRLHCGIPNRQEIVTCLLSGRGFHPHERVHITYRLTFTALPRVHGHLPGKVYSRAAVTNRKGAFQRPPLRFTVVKYQESFRLVVAAVGAAGDRATIGLESIAQ